MNQITLIVQRHGYYCILIFRLSQEKGRNVILSIHQPRYSIYKLFDTMTLLSRGELVYHGPTYQGLQHFADLGKLFVTPTCTLMDVTWCQFH